MEAPIVPPEPLINCHTHVFTANYVPPYLAKTIAPWPFYFIIRTNWIAGLLNYWVETRRKIRGEKWYKQFVNAGYQVQISLKRYFILRLFKAAIITIILCSIFHDQYESFIKPWLTKQGISLPILDKLDNWLFQSGVLITTESWIIKAILLIILFLLFPMGRNVIFAILRQLFFVFRLLPGKQTKELLLRYINIIRFANYDQQFKVYSRLQLQYPPHSKFVVLPMDMEFMGAGKPKGSYDAQMKELAKLKKNHSDEVFPFVFLDPRRITAEPNTFFNYSIRENSVVLEDCDIKRYIESEGFSGFKIYPALGYFPFDERLLPLWKYAADNNLPIMTHCIRGVIYYRGRKLKDWDHHPIFEQFVGKNGEDPKEEDFQPLLLKQTKPVELQEIFTHPLNYVCLYKRELLKQVVKKAQDERIRKLFGYNEASDTISVGLENLKICFGHFGGEDEWARFFEQDRANFGHQLLRNPLGIEFLLSDGEPSRGRLEQIWKDADWYSIICSLMLQHDNVYADISYILHGDVQIMPLLRTTLQHTVLKRRVLYGSDFYVVRNHKSDKNMLADIRGGLLEEEFRLIARTNPIAYLKRLP